VVPRSKCVHEPFRIAGDRVEILFCQPRPAAPRVIAQLLPAVVVIQACGHVRTSEFFSAPCATALQCKAGATAALNILKRF
jgi:hypothetical protein